MNIYPTIEALLHYASAHLLFDELDGIYVRNRILKMLNLEGYEQYEINDSEIENMEGPDELIDTLVLYAISENIIDKENQKDFGRQVLSLLIKKPSEIADLFANLPTTKGFEWLHDYGRKSGYIRLANKKWEAKATKGKIEVAFNGCDCKIEDECIQDEAAKDYPKCRYCLENQGYKSNLLMRGVPIELGEDRLFFIYSKSPILPSQGYIVSEQHVSASINSKVLGRMFDFINMMPTWIIATKQSQHEKYIVSSRMTPFNKAPDRNRFKSKLYPYINVTVIDWYFGAVRLLCTNREKLIEYAEILIARWNEGGNREVGVCVRKIESEYCVELMMLNKDKKPNTAYNLSKCCGMAAYMGVFAINKNTEEQIKKIEKFVSKEEKFSPAKLEGDMAEHADMINRLLLSVAKTTPTPLEAELEVKDEVNQTLENALISLNEPIDELYSDF